ncbi:hypothetical protein Vadar_031118 [Vaccinium darrowii]|uniref:Uncharacterized protein n=1 Tax=Vaccinium darrowii TaxID=229202 RepID=A0ACB7Z7S2_9ERIC|nr:hypothetical protein Vadar_031118 [Vaccinium darrowii]
MPVADVADDLPGGEFGEGAAVVGFEDVDVDAAIAQLALLDDFGLDVLFGEPGEVNSARIADSIHYGCIPVILSNYYDLPFNDILDWHKFSVILKENDVYQLKQILKDMSDSEFVALHKNLVKVQKHFQWNSPPIKYDAFHMVMYDLWLRHHVIKY